MHYFNILALVVTTDIVGFPYHTFGNDLIQRARMVFDIQPVTHLRTVAIHRQRFAGNGIEDHQRDKFFREVVRAVVVGTVGDQRRQAIGPQPGADQMVAGRLGGRIRAAWRVRCGFGEQVIRTVQVAIHFVGGDMVETEALLLLRLQRLPVMPCRLQQGVGSHHVGFDKGRRAINRTVDMAFRRQVHDHIRLILGKHPIQCRAIADIHLLERIAFAISNHRKRFQVAGVSQLIHHHHAVPRGFNNMPDDRGTDKTGAPSD
ncbi:hypothetical protein D3C71_1422610 [compost metagenome]